MMHEDSNGDTGFEIVEKKTDELSTLGNKLGEAGFCLKLLLTFSTTKKFHTLLAYTYLLHREVIWLL